MTQDNKILDKSKKVPVPSLDKTKLSSTTEFFTFAKIKTRTIGKKTLENKSDFSKEQHGV